MIGLLGLLRFKWTYLVVGVVLVGIGLVAYFSAHPSQPVEIDGTIASYVEYTGSSGDYHRNELKLAGRDTTYTLYKTDFHPTMPEEVFRDGKVNIWIDQGSTTIIAITLYDTNDENPVKYTTDHYDNPQSELSDTQTGGIVAAVIGGILIAIFGLWLVLGRRPAAMVAAPIGMPMGVPQAVSASSSPGVSADGKWYWDSGGWQQVSNDGRWRWDGTSWVELGTTYAARGAPPPPSTPAGSA